MDSGFSEQQSFYNRNREPQHQLKQQQQPQLLSHYSNQLLHHTGLLSTHLQQHQSQAAYVLDQPERMRGHSGPGSVALQQQIAGNGHVTSTVHHPSVLNQYSEHSRLHLQPLDHTSQASYVSSSSDQPPTMIDKSAKGQAFVSPDSPTPPQGLAEGDIHVGNAEQIQTETGTANLDPEAQGQVFSSDKDIPKKRYAMLLELTETQQNKGQTSVLREQNLPIPDIWKPDVPSGLSLKFSQDGKRIVGVQSERMIQKGVQFGPFNGKLVEEHIGSVKDATWEICLRGACLYVDGQNKSQNNWMAFIESANFVEEQNLEAFQSYGDIYFRTTQVIVPGSELKVFYSEEYVSHVGFEMKLNELSAVYSKDSKKFNCTTCNRVYPSAKSLLRHMKIYHKPDRANEMLPVVTWKPRNAIENEENKNLTSSSSHVPCFKVRLNPPVKPVKSTSPVLEKEVAKPSGSNVGDERYICTTCGKAFPTLGRLASHETFHAYNTEHTCAVCGVSFPHANNLAKHMTSHKEKPLICDVCGNAFSTRSNLTRHIRLSHTFKYSCRVCEMQFIKKREYDRHKKTHLDLKYLSAIQGKSQKKGRRSKTEYHPEDDDLDVGELASPSGSDGDVNIQEQEEEDVANSSLGKDMLGKRSNYYDSPRPYKCKYCPKRYVSRNAQLSHEAERHTKKCRFKCAHCPSVFTSEYKKIEHMKNHVKVRPFRCQICPASFASESALNNHQGEHTGLKPVKCDECGKGFRTRKFMNAHKRRKHKVQQMRFACSFCNKPFFDKGSLVKHERRHKGIRPFVCLECGSGFTSNHGLKAHSYMHTKEKKFGCPQCDQKFAYNHQVTTHIYKVHTSNFEEQGKGT